MTLPSFITFTSSSIFTVSPILGDIGSYITEVTLIDDHADPKSTVYSFTIIVKALNANAPYFVSSLTSLSIWAEETTIYTLPGTKDDDGDSVTMTAYVSNVGSLPTFISFPFPPGAFTFNPLYTDIG